MTIGEIIKSRREELGASHEDICHGICTVSMLYKVEEGTKSFKPETLAAILERLGMYNIFDGELITTNDYRYVQTVRQANKMILIGNTEKADEMLSDIQVDYERFSVSTKQRFDMCETLLVEKTVGMSHEQKLDNFEKIIRYTINDFNPMKLPRLFTQAEIKVLNVIANCYHSIDDTETAISILSCLKKYIEDSFLDKNEAALRMLIICNNLAVFLEKCSMYDEAIRIAEEGIKWSKSVNVINEATSGCLHTCAVSLLKRGSEGDYEMAKKLSEDAYFSSKIFNLFPSTTDRYKVFIEDNFS